MHLPLKQGLRLILGIPILTFFIVRVHLPLKQGLRPDTLKMSASPSLQVRVHLPLKQGLRLCFFDPNFFFIIVRVHLPLKQGLRRLGAILS